MKESELKNVNILFDSKNPLFVKEFPERKSTVRVRIDAAILESLPVQYTVYVGEGENIEKFWVMLIDEFLSKYEIVNWEKFIEKPKLRKQKIPMPYFDKVARRKTAHGFTSDKK